MTFLIKIINFYSYVERSSVSTLHGLFPLFLYSQPNVKWDTELQSKISSLNLNWLQLSSNLDQSALLKQALSMLCKSPNWFYEFC